MNTLLRFCLVIPLIVILSSCATNDENEPKPLPKTVKGFQVDGTQLLDVKGNPFVMRGINMSHTWFTKQSESTIESAAEFGCNTVRIVLSNGAQWKKNSAFEIRQLLKWCEKRNLVAVVEVHDCTGYFDKPMAGHPDTAVSYWLEPEIMEVLFGKENFVILNIANEPFGNKAPDDVWTKFNQRAISRLREAGYKHTIQIDAPNWGQDHDQIMLNEANDVLASDPLNNTMFSVHMYQVFAEDKTVWDYLRTAKQKNLCMIVGEFGMDHQGEPVAEMAILEACNELDMGYLGWSWCGNSEGVEDLDMVLDFDAEQLTEWGDLLFNHPQWGIKVTSEAASF